MDDIEKKVVQHDEQIKTLFNNVSKLEKITNEINTLALNIEKIAINQTTMIEQQKQLRTDLDEIREQPVKDAHDIKMTVIKCVITGVISAIVGALIALVIRNYS